MTGLSPLPIDDSLEEIRDAVRRTGAFVLLAPPGAGKTTRVPPTLLDDGVSGGKAVVVLEPRRVAARAAASRIASEQGCVLGEEVGYHVRFERRLRPGTRIQVLTTGVFLRRLQRDPFLEDVGIVILDEFHERGIESDLALALLRDVRAEARPDLGIGVMSATLDPEPLARFLSNETGARAAIVRVEGKPFPVTITHRTWPGTPRLGEQVRAAIEERWGGSEGHVLVFLPGMGEIRGTERELERFAEREKARLLVLHGSLPLSEQEEVLAPSAGRKIILATNVAETSLTIEGVDLVVDSGLARVLVHDPRHGIDRLDTVRISKRSATQRAGRAGRLGPGTVVRLWSELEHSSLDEELAPEVRRVGLARAVLQLRVWGVRDPLTFGWFEPPPARSIEQADELLGLLGAVDPESGAVTETGRQLLALPVHPRIGRLLVEGARRGVLERACALAALLEERDIFDDRREAGPGRERSSGETGPSDLLVRLDALEESERRGSRAASSWPRLDPGAVRAVDRLRRELIGIARGALESAPNEGRRQADGARDDSVPDPEEDALLRVLLAGFPDRVARRRESGSERAVLVGGRGVVLDPASVVREGDLFLALDLVESDRMGRQDSLVRLASLVERGWIEEDFPEAIAATTRVEFDERAGRARAWAATAYRDLPLEEPRERPPPPEEAARLLEEAVRRRAEEIVRADGEAALWLERVRFLAAHLPELALPPFSPDELAGALAPLAAGRTKLKEIQDADIAAALRAVLPWETQQLIEREAPTTFEVPSGSRIKLRYEGERPPVLAVRVQELFGMRSSPRVARGRVPVLLHLLGPNFRPVQVTQDLESFWDVTYAQVRKDLRGRYPKHAWPEDPRAARAERSPRRRRE